MIKYFDLDSNQLKIREILTDKSFLEIEIFAISNANPNRNKSHFTDESMKKGIGTFTDKPILGFFNSQGDFESHNGSVSHDPELDVTYWDNSRGEQILGFVRQSDQKEIVERDDGLLWIRCTAMICTQYNYKQVKRLLKDRKKKVSVEVSIKDSEVINGIEEIYDFELMGITILGSKNNVPVREGIEGAQLSVLDLMGENFFAKQKQALVFAYSQLDDNQNKKEDENLAMDEIGTEKALRVDKSKEAMSDEAWGSVDKTELRNRVVAASNFKEVADDVFLDLREGWEDGETTKLKYPVMQIVDEDKLVYNRGALASAKAYAEKNNEEEVLNKLRNIYKHLDLEFESEDHYECDSFCDLYEDEKPACEVSQNAEEPADGEPAKEEPAEGEPASEGEPVEHHAEGEDEGGDDSDDEGKPAEGDEGCDCGHHDEHCEENDGANKVEEYTQEAFETMKAECDELKMKCNALEEKCSEFEAKCCEYEKRCEEYESKIAEYCDKLSEYENKMSDYNEVNKALNDANEKLAAIKTESQIQYIHSMKSKFNLIHNELNSIIEKCEKRGYEETSDIDKDIAYVLFLQNKSVMSEHNAQYNVGIIQNEMKSNKTEKQNLPILERLTANVEK